MFFRLMVKLSPDDFITLQKFSTSEYGNIQDAHHVLSEMVLEVEVVTEYRPPTWAESVGQFLENNMQTILQVSLVRADHATGCLVHADHATGCLVVPVAQNYCCKFMMLHRMNSPQL